MRKIEQGKLYNGILVEDRATAKAVAADPSSSPMRIDALTALKFLDGASAITRGKEYKYEQLCCPVTLPPTNPPEEHDAIISPSMPENQPLRSRLSHYRSDVDQSTDDAVRQVFGAHAAWLAAHPESEDAKLSPTELPRVQTLRERARRKVDNHFDRRIMEEFGLENKDELAGFRESLREEVSRVYEYNNRHLYPDAGSLAPLNDAALPLSAHRVVELVTDPNTDPKLKHEAQIRMAMELTIAKCKDFEHKSSATAKLSQIQEILDRELFEGKVGETKNVKVNAVLDNSTNEVIGVEGIDGFRFRRHSPSRIGRRLVQKQERMRPVKGNGLVLTNPDLKTTEASVAKLIKKAVLRDEEGKTDEIKVETDVQDTHRMLFVVLGNDKNVDHLVSKVYEILNDNQTAFYERDENGELMLDQYGHPKGALISVPDDEINGDRTQSSSTRFRRIQIMMGGEENPFELKFQTYRDFLMSELHVGEFDNTKEQFTGGAHDIYVQNRLETGLDAFLHPQEIYTEESTGVRLTDERLRAKKTLARSLRNVG